jgi:ankyrin repeat protein/Mg2+ and Co2+ transporter CorA
MARSPSIASSDHNERLEPQILRAAESDNVELLRTIIAAARAKGQLNDNFLRIALMRSSEKGKINATAYLLEEGAPPDGAPGNNRPSPLLRAVERDQATIVQLLLKHSATPETKDKKGRTALMTAAWKNHYHILHLLLVHGADVNARDNRGRNVLHNLAADKQCDWGDSVIELLLKQNIAIDGKEGQDELKRTPLHWACATGKIRLADMLLERPKMPRANINAVEIREKTSLHIAAAHDRDDMVEMLLTHGADVKAKSDGGWTPLHNACEKGSEKIVKLLLAAGSEINAKLLNGMSPLHVAAQGGHIDVVRCLLERRDIKRAAVDTFGCTPFLRAAQNRRKDIVELLAPFNHVETLSEDALGACNGFNATIVDFGNFHNENRVKRKTVYELLYARDSVNPRKPANTILPQDSKVINFRWIHLPANNMAWVETLLTKWFIEDGAHDVEGFKALEKSFSHQHRGQQTHSHFMRPLCQSTPRAAAPPRIPDEESTLVPESGPPTIVINGGPSSRDDGFPRTPMKSLPSAEDRKESSKSSHHGKENAKGEQKESKESKESKKSNSKGNKSPRNGTNTPDRNHQRKPSYPLDIRRRHSLASPVRKDVTKSSKGNIFTFMPYLHFETHRRRQEMQEAIERAESLRSPSRPFLNKATTFDEMLIRAHLTTSTVSLHIRRTLDQSFYHNIDTQSRDTDQVVYRYQTKGKLEDPDIDPKIFMVDQLWMWILGKDLIVTSFPQRWQQPKNDPLNVLDSIIEDINSKTRDPVTSVHDLSMIITARCSGVFDRHKLGNEDYQFLDMFEASIGSATDRETILFKEFNTASAQASAWLQHHRRHNRFSVQAGEDAARKAQDEKFKFDDVTRGPLFVDKLLDIGQETDLLAETKDIRDELNMIKKVLEDQALVLPDLESSICEIYAESQTSQRDVKKRFRDQLKTIEMHIKDIDRMDKQAERIYNSITDMLDLKQKHANAFEARFARDQATGTARQSQTIMVFTIVTIVFLPMSFIAAFFSISIDEFPTDPTTGNHSLPLGYVSKYMFGIGLAVSIPLIFIALSLDEISDAWREGRRRWAGWKRRKEGGGRGVAREEDGGLDVLRIQSALSTARSQRKSVDTEWVEAGMIASRGLRLSRETARTGAERGGAEREKVTGFRMRASGDVERGLGVR